MKIEIKKYSDEYLEQVLELMRMNTPAFFAPEEETEFHYFLTEERLPYYILLFADKVIGSGGFAINPDQSSVSLCWDIIHPDFQGKRLGKKLLDYRLEIIKSIRNVTDIFVRTSQFVYLFYEKNGFVLFDTCKDFWAKGYDLYHMKYDKNQ